MIIQTLDAFTKKVEKAVDEHYKDIERQNTDSNQRARTGIHQT